MACRLGTKYTDKITGFSGVATARSTYLHGCVRVCLEGKEGDTSKEYWFDEQRLTKHTTAKTGGPQSTPPSRDPK